MEILSGDFGSMRRLAISLNGLLKHIKLNLLIVIALLSQTQKNDKYVTYIII